MFKDKLNFLGFMKNKEVKQHNEENMTIIENRLNNENYSDYNENNETFKGYNKKEEEKSNKRYMPHSMKNKINENNLNDKKKVENLVVFIIILIITIIAINIIWNDDNKKSNAKQDTNTYSKQLASNFRRTNCRNSKPRYYVRTKSKKYFRKNTRCWRSRCFYKLF